MPTEGKTATIAEIKQKFEENPLAILVQYQGTTVVEITSLRKDLRDAGVEFKVYKNTLTKIAISDMGFDEIKDTMTGPTGYVFAQEPAGASKIVSNFAKENNTFEVKGAVLDGAVISTAQVQALADLPSREVLLGLVAGTILSPVTSLVGCFAGVLRKFGYALNALKEEKEKAA